MAKVLCIEDEAAIRVEIAEELMEAGYETLQASNGQEALEILQKDPPDLVLCDMNMPVMCGTELLRTLRSDHPALGEIPFVFLTAQADRDSMIEGRKLGADAYLTKPIDFELLLVEIESRVSQVDRMHDVKQQEMVKLYKAMSKDEPCAPAKEGTAGQPTTKLESVAAASSLEVVQVRTGEGKLCPMFTCDLNDDSKNRLNELQDAEADAGHFAVEQDLLLLSKIDQKIRYQIESSGTDLFISRVQFATLNDEEHAKRFSGACASLPEAVRRQLGLHIVGVPTALFSTRMHELASVTKTLARIKILELSDHGIVALSELHPCFRLASVRHSTLEKLAKVKPDQVKRAAHEVRSKGTKLMVIGAGEQGLTGELANLTVDFYT